MNGMSTEFCLNDADLRVAHAMGIDPKAVANLKYAHGKGGLGLRFASFKADGLPRSPFPPARKIPGDTGLAGSAPDGDDDLEDEPEEADTDKNLRDAIGTARRKKRRPRSASAAWALCFRNGFEDANFCRGAGDISARESLARRRFHVGSPGKAGQRGVVTAWGRVSSPASSPAILIHE